MADFIELSSGIPMWETAKYTGGHDEIVCELSENMCTDSHITRQ